jgi:hypothetical protein
MYATLQLYVHVKLLRTYMQNWYYMTIKYMKYIAYIFHEQSDKQLRDVILYNSY